MTDSLLTAFWVEVLALMLLALVYPFTRNLYPARKIARQWQKDHYEYQQRKDGKVRRRYNAWGETDFWGRWRRPVQYKQPTFHGFPHA